MTRSHRIESNGHVRRCFLHCRRIIIQLFWESVNRFKSYLTNELHKTSSQTLIHIFHHFLTKRLIKNILNRTINNKIIFSCSRGTFLTVLCDKFSIMYVYVIHSDHFSVTSLRDSTFFWFLFLYNIFKMIHNWMNWPLLSRSHSVLLAEAQEEVERTSWTQQHVTLHVENRLYISVQSIHSFTLNVFELFLSLTVSPLW